LVPSSSQQRAKIFLTPAQAILQEQLRMKHADLTRRILQQQEELKKISEQASAKPCVAGLPDCSSYMIPKSKKCTKPAQNVPNGNKFPKCL
jgi:hypothetical protein